MTLKLKMLKQAEQIENNPTEIKIIKMINLVWTSMRNTNCSDVLTNISTLDIIFLAMYTK